MSAKKVIFINCCISIQNPSRTERLCKEVMTRYENSEEFVVEEVDIRQDVVSALDSEKLKLREDLIAGKNFGHSIFDLANQFAAADIIVIGAPYWDLSFPAHLKSYIENIMVSNITFTYTQEGLNGLCKAEKLIYVTTSGGYIGELNLGYDYIKAVANMMGIENTGFISAEGLDIYGNDVEAILNEALLQIHI
ncbi:MAG: NAD(P)H-dependent oxidoreductase [Aminipila sp.]